MRSLHPRAGSRFDNRVERAGEGFNSLLLYLIPAAFFAWLLLATEPYQTTPQPSPRAVWQEGRIVDSVIPALIRAESGGDHRAVSRKGARGLTQIMPRTARNPGYGVEPLRDRSEREAVRFTRDYLEAMHDKYEDMDLTLAAYNAGPRAVDNALEAARGDKHRAISYLPAETRAYIRKINGQPSLGELMDSLQVAR